MVATTSTGEIVSVAQADQFQWANGRMLSEYECGYFSVMIARSMAQVGHPPTLTPAQIIAQAEAFYAQYDGNNLGTNTDGMTLQQEYDLLHQVGLHYQETALDVNTVKAWIQVGYPVCVAVTEISVFDMGLGENPYPWRAAGTHVILITGVASDGNVLARDSANCTNLYDPNSLRPGPRKYSASRLQIVSATVVVPPELPRPASATPPLVAPTPPAGTGWGSVYQEQAALAEWNSTAAHMPNGAPPPYNTGIALEWQANYRAEIFDGPPLGLEYGIRDWAGRPIRVIKFARKRYEWDGEKANRY